MHRTHGIGCDRIGSGRLGNTKVRHLDLSLFGNDNILRLNIPVNDMIVVSCFHTLCNLNGNPNRLIHIKLSLGLDELFEGDSLNKLHNNIVIVFILINIIYIYYIRMRQSCD